MNRTFASMVAVSAAALALGACGGHGQHTTAALNAAQDKMEKMKSGIEWQTAQQQFLSGDLEKALKSVDSSIALNEEVGKSHLLRGRILMELGNLPEAEKSFARAIALDATAVEPHYYMGVLQERQNKPDAALAAFVAALDLEPTKTEYLVAAAETLMQRGDLEKAEALLAERGKTVAEVGAVRQLEGQIATLRGDHARAALLLGEARLMSPDDDSVLENLARAQLAAGEAVNAEYSLSALLEKEAYKGRRDLKQLRAQALTKAGRYTESRSILLELTSDSESQRDVNSWIELGSVSYILGDEMRVRSASAKVMAMAPERHEGYLLRAMQLERAGELERALAAVTQAEDRGGDDAETLMLKGLILRRMGREQLAQVALDAAKGAKAVKTANVETVTDR